MPKKKPAKFRATETTPRQREALKHVYKAPVPLNVAQLAAKLGCSRSTAGDLARVLEYKGMIRARKEGRERRLLPIGEGELCRTCQRPL